MKKSFKGLLAAALAVLSVGSLVACSNDEPKEPAKPEEPKYEEKDFQFTGEQKLNLLKYDENGPVMMPNPNPNRGPQDPAEVPATEKVDFTCVLDGKVASKTFTLVLSSKEETPRKFNYSGKYEFSDGVGFKFVFNGTNTIVNTTFDTETKEHEFIYEAPLQKYGRGEVTLHYKDEQFTISEEKLFLSNVLFGGGYFSKDGIIIENPQKKEKGIGFSLKLYANGEYKFNNNHVAELRQDGTYTFDKTTKEFTFNFLDADKKTPVVAKSTFKDGVFSLPLEFNYTSPQDPDKTAQKLNVTLEYNANYYGGHSLSGIGYPMGSPFRINLTLKNDEKHTVFMDGSPVDPMKGALAGMNLFHMFDKEGTWSYDKATNVYTIKYMDMVMGPNGQPVMENGRPKMIERTFTTTYDEATKVYTIKDFELAAAKLTLTGTDFGKDFVVPAE